MTDWESLQHAYGPASDIPSLLAQLSPDPAAEVWEALFSRLAHQGTAYSASFAALPVLESVAREWRPADRAAVLSLAGAIVASDEFRSLDETARGALAPTVSRLHELAVESLGVRHRPQSEYLHVLQAARAFADDLTWGRHIDRLTDGELVGVCPTCSADLYIAIGEHGFFVTTEDWVGAAAVRREAIAPATAPLPAPGEWMRGRATDAGQADVARWLGYVFGTGRCTECGHDFPIAEAVALSS